MTIGCQNKTMDLFDELPVESKADEVSILMARHRIYATEIVARTGLQASEICRALRVKQYGDTLRRVRAEAYKIIEERAAASR